MIEWMILIFMHLVIFVSPMLFFVPIAFDAAMLYIVFSSPRNRAYGRYVWIHKLRVYQAGRRIGVGVIYLLIHDWDKLLPGNWVAYAEQFYTEDGETWPEQRDYSAAFKREWNSHQKKNRHHWQYWIMIWDHGGEEVRPMLYQDALEMLADWVGAGCAIKGTEINEDDIFEETRKWYDANRNKMRLHPDTREFIEGVMEYVDSE